MKNKKYMGKMPSQKIRTCLPLVQEMNDRQVDVAKASVKPADKLKSEKDEIESVKPSKTSLVEPPNNQKNKPENSPFKIVVNSTSKITTKESSKTKLKVSLWYGDFPL